MGPSRSCWNGTTSALQLEEITSKGTSFMCVLSIKKSGNLSYAPRMSWSEWICYIPLKLPSAPDYDICDKKVHRPMPKCSQ